MNATLSDFKLFDGYESKYATATIVVEKTFQTFFDDFLHRITLNLRFDEYGFKIEENLIEYFNLPMDERELPDADDFLTQEELEKIQQMPEVKRLIEEFEDMALESA